MMRIVEFNGKNYAVDFKRYSFSIETERGIILVVDAGFIDAYDTGLSRIKYYQPPIFWESEFCTESDRILAESLEKALYGDKGFRI